MARIAQLETNATASRAGERGAGASQRLRLLAVVVNYRTPGLVLDCLASLRGELDPDQDRVVLVDNGSGDGSAERIEAAVAERRWGRWVHLLRSPTNGGFSAGNNLGIQSADADAYLLLNSDTIVRPGAVASLLRAMRERPDAGIIGPRLEWPDGTPQVSCFRCHSPISEFVTAAATGPLTKMFRRWDVPMPIPDRPIEPEWVSFACVLIRRQALERVGPLDDGYFMYREDCDYCQRTRQAGRTVLHWPEARVVHLQRGLSYSSRERRPQYYYASRARYFAKFYGRAGLFAANVLWTVGRAISLTRELLGSKQPHTFWGQWCGNWTNWLTPARRHVGSRSRAKAR